MKKNNDIIYLIIATLFLILAIVFIILSKDNVQYYFWVEVFIVAGLAVVSAWKHFREDKLKVQLIKTSIYLFFLIFGGFKIYEFFGELKLFWFIVLSEIIALLINFLHKAIKKKVSKNSTNNQSEDGSVIDSAKH